MRFGEGGNEIPYYLARPGSAPAAVPELWAPYDPNIALAPAGSVPYYLEAPPLVAAGDFFSQYKWWLVGGGVAFLLAGGSILGLSLRRLSLRRKKRR